MSLGSAKAAIMQAVLDDRAEKVRCFCFGFFTDVSFGQNDYSVERFIDYCKVPISAGFARNREWMAMFNDSTLSHTGK